MALINGRILAHDIGMKSKNPHINMHTPQAIKDTNELYFFACNVRMAELVYVLHTCTYHLPVGRTQPFPCCGTVTPQRPRTPGSKWKKGRKGSCHIRATGEGRPEAK